MGLLGRAPRARYEGMQHENNATPRRYWRRHSKERSMKLTILIRFNDNLFMDVFYFSVIVK